MLAETVGQIAQRYPHGSILEAGAGMGGAILSILKSIGDDFSTYTFIGISARLLGNAQSDFAPYKDRTIYSILDLEQDMQMQGLKQQPYSVVVAAFILYATKSLE